MAVAFDAKPTAWNSADGLDQQAAGATSVSASTGMSVGASATVLVGAITYQNGAAGGADPGAISAWTWNGVSRTGILESGVNSDGTDRFRAAIAWWVSPATGTKTLTASWTSSADAYMSCASFTGGDTTTPVITADNVTGTTGATVTVTSDANGMTVAVWGTNGSAPTVNFNKIYANAPLRPCGAASYQAGGSSNGHTFTGGGGTTPGWAGIHLQATQGGGGTTNRIKFPYWLDGTGGGLTGQNRIH